MTDELQAPNHHAHYPGFAGWFGLVAALSMATGRGGDARLAAQLSGVGRDDVVVDIGCGPGEAARHAARLGARVTGVDPAAVMLRVARVLGMLTRRVRFVKGRAEALPVPDDFATVVWAIATVHHWPDLERAVKETRRVLRDGGRFVAMERLTTPHAQGLESHGWTRAQAEAFADVCREHGFTNVEVDEHKTDRRNVVSVVARAG